MLGSDKKKAVQQIAEADHNIESPFEVCFVFSAFHVQLGHTAIAAWRLSSTVRFKKGIQYVYQQKKDHQHGRHWPPHEFFQNSNCPILNGV